MGEPKIKQDEITKDLSSLELTNEQIESGEFPLDEVYELKNNGEPAGLFWQYHLKDYIQQEKSFDESAEIRPYGQEKWQALFNHPFFQRRRPHLIQAMDAPLGAEEFHLLENGQKSGPFTLEQVKEMVENKTILLTDMVSVDKGLSWGKIFEIEEFDRRQLNINHNLPHMPEENVLKSAEPKVASKVQGQNMETDAIAGLAYVGNMKSGKNVEKDSIESFEESSDMSNTQWIQLFWVGLFICSFVGIIWLFYPSDKTTQSTKGTKLGKLAPVQEVKPVKTWKADEKAPPREIRKTPPARRPATSTTVDKRDHARNRKTTPFKKTKTYIQAQEQRSNRQNNDDYLKVEKYDDEAYYDDASDPVELDPVRRTLSKETIDPEESEYTDDYDTTGHHDPAAMLEPPEAVDNFEETY